jgi:BMFP domain-containing protein YqiC
MQTQNRYLDDLARLLTNAAGAAKGIGHEIETIMRQQAERVMSSFDFVPRDEFEALKARLAKLEGELGSRGAKSAATARSSDRKKAEPGAKKKTSSGG